MAMKPLLLAILDGWGINPRERGNPIKLAHTPNMDHYWKNYPHTTLKAHGEAVGLPKRGLGGSEVAHPVIGGGRRIYQKLTQINNSITDKSFFKNKVLLDAINQVKKKGSNLHLIGMLSDGGVHSHINHLFALLELCAKLKVSPYIHAFLDGRDTLPQCAEKYLVALQKKFKKLKVGKIASIIGRYYAMDRDHRWDRTKEAYDLLVLGNGYTADDPVSALKTAYKRGEGDEFVKPTIIDKSGTVKDGDSIIFFNFRADRARQLTHAFVDKDFNGFQRVERKVHFVCMDQYEKDIRAPAVFPLEHVKNTLGEVLSKNDLRQLRIAETEKYAHVTFYFNCGREEPFPGEERILVPSPRVPTYDQKPEMSAYEVTEKLLKEIKSKKFDVIILNFANPDMVGHTGVLEASIKAVKVIDECLGKVVDEVRKQGGTVIVTSDHGNVEEKVDSKGRQLTAHTLNPVPFILISDKKVKVRKGELRDIAPTMLQILKIPKPKEMDGKSLI